MSNLTNLIKKLSQLTIFNSSKYDEQEQLIQSLQQLIQDLQQQINLSTNYNFGDGGLYKYTQQFNINTTNNQNIYATLHNNQGPIIFTESNLNVTLFNKLSIAGEFIFDSASTILTLSNNPNNNNENIVIRLMSNDMINVYFGNNLIAFFDGLSLTFQQKYYILLTLSNDNINLSLSQNYTSPSYETNTTHLNSINSFEEMYLGKDFRPNLFSNFQVQNFLVSTDILTFSQAFYRTLEKRIQDLENQQSNIITDPDPNSNPNPNGTATGDTSAL